MIKQEITREILEELYISKQYSLKEIALVYKTTATVIQRKMIKFELKTRSASEAKTIKRNRSAANITENQKEQVKLLFKNKETRANIAKTVELKYKDVNGILVEAGLILEKREVKNLTPLQRQVILGSLLGDGCITNSKGKVAYVETHCEAQKEYAEYKAKILNKNISGPRTLKIKKLNNKEIIGTPQYYFSYHNKPDLKSIHDTCYSNSGKKMVTESWLSEISTLGLCLWFLDDGNSLIHDKSVVVRFATNSFSLAECELLCKMLKTFGCTATAIKSNGYVVHIWQESVEHFMNLIEPHVKEIPCMMYKVKRRSQLVTVAVKIPKIDKETLERLYLKEKLSIHAIAKQFDSYGKLVHRLLLKFNIPTRQDGVKTVLTPTTIVQIKELHAQKLSLRKIAKILDISPPTVKRGLTISLINK